MRPLAPALLTLVLSLACTGGAVPLPSSTPAPPPAPRVDGPPIEQVPSTATASAGNGPPVAAVDGRVPRVQPPPSAGERQPAPASSTRIRRADLERDFGHVTGLGDVVSLRPNVTMSGIDGLVVRGIPKGSPLTRLGLQTGDIVHSVNGHQLGSSLDLLGLMTAMESATVFEGDITRNGRPHRIRVVLD